MKSVSIFPVTRIESEGKLILYVDENGIIKKAHFFPFMPIRGFERMLIGKDLEFLPVAVMRICGVCHVTHGIAGAEAAEEILHIDVPKDGIILREICGLGNRLQSHALHMLSISKDLLGSDKKTAKRIFTMLEIAGEIVKISGHEKVHPSNICVGGMRKNISKKGKEEIVKLSKKYMEEMQIIKDLLLESLANLKDNGEIPENMGNVNFQLLATDPYYGDPSKVEMLDISHIPPKNYYEDDMYSEEAASAVVKYKNEIAEVGPKARMKMFFKSNINVPLSINIYYAEDAIKGCERIIDLCDEINIDGETKNFGMSSEGRGIGIHEAPRGTNIHILRLRRDGIIMDYRIIVPTMFNIPVIDSALVGAPKEYGELIVRSYDPCLSCATHIVYLNESKIEDGGLI